MRTSGRIRRCIQCGLLAVLTGAHHAPAFAAAETDPSSPKSETFGEKVDRLHAGVHDFLQRQVEHVDHWFVRKNKEVLPVPAFEIRLGLYRQVELDTRNNLVLKMPVDFDTNNYLPNTNRFLKLKLTNCDPTLIPGASPLKEKRAPRTAVER